MIALVIGQGLVLYKQGQQRYPVAGKIIEEKINELTNQVGYARLVKMIGQPGQTEEKIVDGVTYYIGYHVEMAVDIAVSNRVRVKGYARCITLIPFTNYRLGPDFDYLIEG